MLYLLLWREVEPFAFPDDIIISKMFFRHFLRWISSSVRFSYTLTFTHIKRIELFRDDMKYENKINLIYTCTNIYIPLVVVVD